MYFFIMRCPPELIFAGNLGKYPVKLQNKQKLVQKREFN